MRFANRTVGKNFIGRALKRFKTFIKVGLNHTTASEALGFKYVGIFDGHNIKELVNILRHVKNADKAVILHVKTIKGKGVAEAENNPSYYHGVGSHLKSGNSTFSSSISQILDKFAQKDERITAICAGMKDGTGLSEFAVKYPNRFFDVGIAEEHAVTFSAGQAIGGLKPIVCMYSTFLQRSYDQIMHDVCLQNLPVIFMIDRAGAVGADGATHQGLFDISYLRSMPNMNVFAVKDVVELEDVLNHCLKLNEPCAIRYPNGNNPVFEKHIPISESLWEVDGEGDTVILAVGPRMLRLAYEVKEKAQKSLCVINARSIKPLYKSILDTFAGKKIIVLEENVLEGGFGSSVLEYVSKEGIKCDVICKAFPDKFISHATVDEQLKEVGFTVDSVLELI